MKNGENGGRATRRWIPALATALVAVALASYLWRSREFIAASYSLDSDAFAGVAALTLCVLVLRAAANRLHFSGLGIALPWLDWFRLVAMTAFTNYLPFSAGLVAKGVFLKRAHAVPYGRYAVGQTTLLVVVMATNGVAGLAILATRFPDALAGVVGAGFAALAASGALLFLPEHARQRLSTRWFPFAGNPRSRGRIAPVALLQLATLATSAASLMLCFRMGESRVDLFACALFTAAAVLTRFVTIVPGALGVREFLIGGLASLVGFELRDAVVAASLARAAEIVVVFALGGAFTWSFSRRLVGEPE